MDLVNWTIGTDYMCSDNTVKNVVVHATASSLSGRHSKGMLKVTISLHIEVPGGDDLLKYPSTAQRLPQLSGWLERLVSLYMVPTYTTSYHSILET